MQQQSGLPSFSELVQHLDSNEIKIENIINSTTPPDININIDDINYLIDLKQKHFLSQVFKMANLMNHLSNWIQSTTFNSGNWNETNKFQLKQFKQSLPQDFFKLYEILCNLDHFLSIDYANQSPIQHNPPLIQTVSTLHSKGGSDAPRAFHSTRLSAPPVINSDVSGPSIQHSKPSKLSLSPSPARSKKRKSRISKKKNKECTFCAQCTRKDTPEWRKGPDGCRSLCNACGLFYAKLVKKHNRHVANIILEVRRTLHNTEVRTLPNEFELCAIIEKYNQKSSKSS